MPDRIPLRSGKTTPEFVEAALAVFGHNIYSEPNYRLIWSERKQIYFAGEIAEEYVYLPHPAWVLETWLPPGKDAGREIDWNEFQEAMMGPYPRYGTYMYSQHFPADWEPSEASVRLFVQGIEASKHIEMREREKAIRENLEEQARIAKMAVADEIVESFGSAEYGKVTQAASGRPNVFRTAEDFRRDAERATPVPSPPRHGGKLVN